MSTLPSIRRECVRAQRSSFALGRPQFAPYHGIFCRSLATSTARTELVRGLIYKRNGDPTKEVRGHVWDLGSKPARGEVLLQVGLASLNPADINVIQGVYPAKPGKRSLPGLSEDVYVGGNEGYAIVKEVGEGTTSLESGDWVVFGQPQMGTWRSHIVCPAGHVIKIERRDEQSLSPVMASTLQVNPATAYRMLHDFVNLSSTEDVVVQNAANSAVGQAVAQICSRKLNVPTINFVRRRKDMREVDNMFKSFGDDCHVYTYEDMRERGSDLRKEIKQLIGKRTIRLGLNALCGPDTADMTKLLGTDATLVTYGAMSRQPLSVPAGLVIFSNLSVRGFMMNKWYAQHDAEERRKLMQTLTEWYEQGILEPPRPHEIIKIPVSATPDDLTEIARKAFESNHSNTDRKKIFFGFHLS